MHPSHAGYSLARPYWSERVVRWLDASTSRRSGDSVGENRGLILDPWLASQRRAPNTEPKDIAADIEKLL